MMVEITDTTQHQRITREKALLTQLGGSRAMIRQLAHEMKNPLGGLRGAAQLLERQLPDADAEGVHARDHRGSRPPRARSSTAARTWRPPRKEPHQHPRITEHVGTCSRPRSRPASTIVRDYDPSLPSITVDRNQMIQAFLNLGAQRHAGAR